MCLGVPARIIKKQEPDKAVADFGGISKEISLMLLSEVKTGDYVLVHAGFALQLIDEQDVAETLKMFEQLSTLAENMDE